MTVKDGERVAREVQRIVGQIERGEVVAGPGAARDIARRIETQGGFWDTDKLRGSVLASVLDSKCYSR